MATETQTERVATAPLATSQDAQSWTVADVCDGYVKSIPIHFARRFGVLALRPCEGCLPVAIADLRNRHAVDKLATVLGLPAFTVLMEHDPLSRLIDQAYGAQSDGVARALDALEPAASVQIIDEEGHASDLLDGATASPVTRLVNAVLLDAVKRRASDVHVQPFEDRLQVRLRIDGVLYDYTRPPPHLLDEIVSRIKVMGRMNIAEKRIAQDGRTTVRVGEKVIDLRISTLPTCHGERVVLRLLDKSARLYRLTELGMCDRDLAIFRQLIQKTHGIFLVTGPTGSGKSTTLYAALQELNSTELNILTLEDPIEYQLPGVSQTQVSEKKGMTFATGLRTVLRQDPDVIMVGEIRDQETARMAIQSSLTGHLVFSTLHTNDAPGAVARLLDLGVEPYLVSGSLLGVLAQRLIRRVCENCRRERPLNDVDGQALSMGKDQLGQAVFDAVGCTSCENTGYRDRVGVFELLLIRDAMRELIAAASEGSVLRRAAIEAGMTTLRDDAVRKMLNGRTTVAEVLRVTQPNSAIEQ